MPEVFVDSACYIALINRRDQDHQIAVDRFEELRNRTGWFFVTSHAVIFEVLAFYSRSGPELRDSAARFVQRLRLSPRTTILPITHALFEEALDLFERRLDQRCSLADCSSMVIASSRGITNVLTTDTDFRVEGFTILMRDQ